METQQTTGGPETQALDNKISLEKAKNRSGRQFCKKLGSQGILGIRALLKSGRFNAVWFEVLNSMTARNDNAPYCENILVAQEGEK